MMAAALARAFTEGFRRVYPDAEPVPNEAAGARLARALERVDEDGRPIVLIGQWCPHGRRYRVTQW